MSGTLVIISSPSGGGKTTIIAELLRGVPNSARFVTSTTRPPRPGENSGVDYNFLTRSEFIYKIVKGDFVEHIKYAENYYGVDKQLLQKMLAKFKYVFAPIDVRGAASLRALPIQQTSIFLLPESREILERRLAKRAGMTPVELTRRMTYADTEIAAAAEFDTKIINRDGRFGETVALIQTLLTASSK